MINFPNAPIEGDTFTYGSNVWIYYAANNQWRSFAVGSISAASLLLKAANLSDVADAATARANLTVSSTTQVNAKAVAMAIALG